MGDAAMSFTHADGYRPLEAEHIDYIELASLETKLIGDTEVDVKSTTGGGPRVG